MQTTSQILMVRPAGFRFNEQTAGNNKFQQASEQDGIQANALKEFDDFVAILRANGVEVKVVDDTLTPETPDSIFPNNWISFHDDGSLYLYPMFSENRRLERRADIIESLKENFQIAEVTDLSNYEAQGIFLEGTGSMVLDRENKIAYACLSVRTNEQVLSEFCAKAGYVPMLFKATDADGFPIYHTNVMMCIADKYAVVCMESIRNEEERKLLLAQFNKNTKEIIDISLAQMNHFAGNMLQVENTSAEKLLVMSEQAYLSLSQTQIESLEKYNKIIHAPLYTIEKNGGGSARCMLAEIHLPKL